MSVNKRDIYKDQMCAFMPRQSKGRFDEKNKSDPDTFRSTPVNTVLMDSTLTSIASATIKNHFRVAAGVIHVSPLGFNPEDM